MAEPLVSAILDQFVSIAAREAEQEIRLVVGVKKEVEKLERNLKTIHAVLEDAEKRQLTDTAVKVWLQKLKDVSYEMDDVLDEWNTALIQSEIEKEEAKSENSLTVEKKGELQTMCHLGKHILHKREWLCKRFWHHDWNISRGQLHLQSCLQNSGAEHVA